jgi:hypothetical protein
VYRLLYTVVERLQNYYDSHKTGTITRAFKNVHVLYFNVICLLLLFDAESRVITAAIIIIITVGIIIMYNTFNYDDLCCWKHQISINISQILYGDKI